MPIQNNLSLTLIQPLGQSGAQALVLKLRPVGHFDPR